jgi:hypothetical protein
MRQHRHVLPLTATIPPGARAIVTATLRSAFRPERLTISPLSFPVPAWRRFWTWPFVHVGSALRHGHRALARLLRINLYALHERHELVGDDYAGEDVIEDEDDGLRYRVIQIPLNLRERFLRRVDRAAHLLGDIRLRWQYAHVGRLVICDITINAKSGLKQAGALPADLFATASGDSFVAFETCPAEHDISVEIENGSQRECQLLAMLIGTAPGVVGDLGPLLEYR